MHNYVISCRACLCLVSGIHAERGLSGISDPVKDFPQAIFVRRTVTALIVPDRERDTGPVFVNSSDQKQIIEVCLRSYTC